jgi:N-acetylmuramoyl-L-alanine amidase
LTFISRPSPNFNERVSPPDMVVLHYTGMPTASHALERMTNEAEKVSAHYCVDEDGSVYQLVAEERRAWHAGVSFWKGQTDINSVSVGIEIVNPGHEFGYRDFPTPQIEAVIGLLDAIRGRWDIPDHRILGHSDVAPERKEDPGERFPWQQLAQSGHGLWVEPTVPPEGVMGPALDIDDTGPGVFALQAALGKLGYNILPGGPYDVATKSIVSAFQRHWVQRRFDGLADALTRVRLMALLRQITLLEV